MAQYDLTPKLAAFLDPHLTFPLLQFQGVLKFFNNNDLLKAQYQIIQKTYCSDTKKELARKVLSDEEKTPTLQKIEEEKKIVTERLNKLRENNLVKIILNSTLFEQLQTEEHLQFSYLSQNHQITQEDLLDLLQLAKLEFDSGNYGTSSKYLAVFRTLYQSVNEPKEKFEKIDKEKMISATWGKLASDILVSGSSKNTEDWLPAINSLNYLRSQLTEGRNINPLKLLIQRTWLIHWGLFIYFSTPEGPLLMLEHFFDSRDQKSHSAEHFLHAIQINAPYLLRYLTIAFVLNRRRTKYHQNYLKELVKILQFEEYNYHDPCTEFLTLLYINFNFEGALDKLVECKEVLANDFFLKGYQKEFIENAKLSTFDTYCRIHSRIDINFLKQKLNFDQNTAEKWIINLIHQAKMDATIDSDKNQIIMKPQNPSLYQSILSHAKETSNRTNQLTLALSKIAQGFSEDHE